MAIIQDIAQANALIAQLQAKLADANKPRAISMKIGEKGGLSVYGLGRFPVTLYRGQWERLLNEAPAIREFIAANASRLSVKD